MQQMYVLRDSRGQLLAIVSASSAEEAIQVCEAVVKELADGDSPYHEIVNADPSLN